MEDDGAIISPGGQSMDRVVEEARAEAYKLVQKIGYLPLEQRESFFGNCTTLARDEMTKLKTE
jgi:hypothetical protein